MKNPHDVIRRLERYADKAGTTPAAIARKVTANPRMWERLKRRVKQLENDIERLDAFMSDNPLQDGECADRHKQSGHKALTSQEARAE